MKMKKHAREYSQEQIFSKFIDKVLLKRLFVYLRPYRSLLALAIFFLCLSKAIEAAVPVFIGNVSQKILNGATLEAIEKQSLFMSVIKTCLFLLGLLVASYIFDCFNVLLKSRISQKALFDLRQQVYEHTLRLPLSYYDQHTIGRLMTRTIHDVDQINQMFAESVIPIIGNCILFIGILIGMFFIDWKVALFITGILPLTWLLTHQFRYYQRVCYTRIRSVVSAMNTFVQENLMGALTIRSFGLQKSTRAQFEEINEDHCNAYLESTHHFAFFIAGIDLLQNFSLIMVFILLVYFSPSGAGFQAGTYFTFSLYAIMFFRPLVDLAERYNVLQSAMAAAERIFSILDTPPEVIEKGKRELKEIISLSFDNVWFAYEGENWVLKGISFEIQQGESVAIVGITGEGKTTITNLILRLYEHQKGVIRINGYDHRDYSLADVRNQFSVVMQDPVIFSGTIEDNISLYSPKIGRQEIESVIEHLHLHSFIEKFPNGLLHTLTERGKGLSAGELQLISMARAVAHHRSMFILDEATANIDTVMEKLIQRTLKAILRQRTALIIAHRLSTIKDVSRILVIAHGVVAESGTHLSLLEAKGIYEKLYRLQFRPA